MKYISAVLGLLLTAASAFMLWHLMQSATPDRHLVYLAAGGVGFGMLLIIPTIIVTTLKSLLGVIGPYIPVIGGRRSTDPPVGATAAITPAPGTAPVAAPALDLDKDKP